jgi:8-oxo-dGTP pyrophosphatase MutT (NUDIX family)
MTHPMQLNSDIVSTPPRDAATVVMLRDTAHGLEVFLVKRHQLSDVMGGAYVFPGGKLDTADCNIDAQAHLDQTPAHLQHTLGESDTSASTATGLYVAAVREAFEESGVLFAQAAMPADLSNNALPFGTLLAQHALRLHTRALVPWSRWITPLMPSVGSKRFDTRFFVACMPSDQTATHDNVETTESVWLPPRTALAQYWDGQIQLAPPQIMSLAHLARHTTVDSVLTQARRQPPPTVLPIGFDVGGERVICYPGDAQHGVPARALPGPTRLHYRNRRFEPEGGFEALFG